jgi:hypothetical protein
MYVVGTQFVTADTAVGGSVIAAQQYIAGRVASAIAALARGVKNVSGGNAWVSAYYGCEYTIRSGPLVRFHFR